MLQQRVKCLQAEATVTTTSQTTTGRKDDHGKPDPSLIFSGFPRALLEVSRVATFGAKKYGRHNWRCVENGITRYTAAMDRHRLAETIETTDADTRLLHAAHTAWNALARLELMLNMQPDDTQPTS